MMEPTMELRFVERWVGVYEHRKERILQQKWVGLSYNGELLSTEWRDVPVEKEPT
jgi:hypothetical protein